MSIRKALLVGINEYPQSPLRGCVNDVRQINDLITNQFGFEQGGIKLLLDTDATYSGIQAGLEWLAQGGDKADAVRVFHYSGHGSYVADKNGDEPDGRDECLVPVDYQTAGMITDDVLKKLYDTFPKSGNLTLIMDSCHSGSVQRDVAQDVVFRFLPVSWDEQMSINTAKAKYLKDRQQFIIQLLKEMPEAPASDAQLEAKVLALSNLFEKKRFGDVHVREGNVLLAGCRDDQTCADAYICGEFHGAFTYFLVETIIKANHQLTYHELAEITGQKLFTNHYTQTPQLEYRSKRDQALIFSAFRT